jgi:hypothetical protein
MCDTNNRNFLEHDQRLLKILRQTSNYDELVKKINENDAQRRMLENRLSSEIANVRGTGEINRTQISYINIEMAEQVYNYIFLIFISIIGKKAEIHS